MNIHKPFLQTRQALNPIFKLVHRLLREFNPVVIGLGHKVHSWVQPFPSHRARIGQHRFNRIEQSPVPVIFQDALASLNRIVLAVIRRIVGQADMQAVVVDKVDHALHELSATAMVFWPII